MSGFNQHKNSLLLEIRLSCESSSKRGSVFPIWAQTPIQKKANRCSCCCRHNWERLSWCEAADTCWQVCSSTRRRSNLISSTSRNMTGSLPAEKSSFFFNGPNEAGIRTWISGSQSDRADQCSYVALSEKRTLLASLIKTLRIVQASMS